MTTCMDCSYWFCGYKS